MIRKVSFLAITSFLCSIVEGNFSAGRIKPGRFEYPKLNGWMSIDEAKIVCEADSACGGFTFKGPFADGSLHVDAYFFHFVPSNTFNDSRYFYWSTYEPNRKLIILPGKKMKEFRKLSSETNW